MTSIDVTKLKELIANDPNLVIIDVRTDGEIAEGRIPGAVWMDLSQRDFMTKAAALPKEKTYCFYCASGGRTMMVVPFMESSGFKNVYDLEGGILAWDSAGEEIVVTPV